MKRADRNFAELLQELRVAQTGVQILFAFLLGLAFTDRFAELDDTERGIYIATLAACALTEALLVAPVMLHRLLFQCGLKRELVWIGHRFIVVGLCGLLSPIVGGLLLVIDVCFGGPVAAITGVAIAAVFASLWAGPALYLRHHYPPAHLHDEAPTAARAAPIAANGNRTAVPRLRGSWTPDETGRLTLRWPLIDPPTTLPPSDSESVWPRSGATPAPAVTEVARQLTWCHGTVESAAVAGRPASALR